ncbi:PREDICTED: uncharacterized family 31 glucosidase KIAA1161-like [Priapulus caudatus]|uniref:Uncharacterized family 31 glucosidase KIAA1161-like n=1 Tax=Priapulus caudatus TaxID=37621 RepID=A0ABM1E4J1_PRICU|nr:PREDICTED: uncharacterized family 31 glucosidase KIAA1161-like [Priapulus caudatus]XP_014667112.1 PREDICTED: uncharacterized family 31 glucosidase KIAA1161-like [Priapulus caudatus]XP_014667113.1 PREDICTED: uncharacterized family 31 glucosidase KIAA1161-like [Priapulus caudatus]
MAQVPTDSSCTPKDVHETESSVKSFVKNGDNGLGMCPSGMESGDTLGMIKEGDTVTDPTKCWSGMNNCRKFMQDVSKLKIMRKLNLQPNFLMKLFVATLFITIVISVSLIFHFSNHHPWEGGIGHQFHFLQETRRLQVDYGGLDGRLVGELGTTIPTSQYPYNCDSHNNDPDTDRLCYEWRNHASLLMQRADLGDTRCYDISWRGQQSGGALMDCYDLSTAHWYGSGFTYEQFWPLEYGSRSMEPYINGDVRTGRLGGVLQRAWISSHAATITVDADVPLFVSINSTENPGQLCMMSQYTGLYENFNVSSRQPWLDYRVCVSNSMRTVSTKLLEGLPRVTCMDEDILFHISWTTNHMGSGNLTQTEVTELAEQIWQNNMTGGRLVIGENWESSPGDLTFDPVLFPDPTAMISALNARNLTLSLGVHPYASTNSQAFQEGITRGYWLRSSMIGDVPELVRWKGDVAATLDVTSPASRQWFLSRLTTLFEDYSLQGFSIMGGRLTSLPHMFAFENPGASPADFLERYLGLFEQALWQNRSRCHHTGSGLDVGVAANTQGFPATIRLPAIENSWGHDNGLRSVIPRALTTCLLGYPLMASPVIDWSRSMEWEDQQLFYLRWVQLAILFPILEINSPPWIYDAKFRKAVEVQLYFRQAIILPRLMTALEDFNQHGLPLWRPLWWKFPDDEEALLADSQFMLGETLLIAPVLNADSHRNIYLPSGEWQDETVYRESTIVGPKWLTYHTVLDVVPHFILVK